MYAEKTEVSVDKSIGEILSLIKGAGAERLAQGELPEGFIIQCFLRDRLLKFKVLWPTAADVKKAEDASRNYWDEPRRQKWLAQRKRQRARALLLVIKAKLESIESGIETFDEAFLANVVTPDGPTVAEWLIPQIERGYEVGGMPTQLLIEGGK